MPLLETEALSADRARNAALPSAPSSPSAAELAVLSPMERIIFRLVHRMNGGRWKDLWTWCQRVIGAGWIHLATYNIMRVYGLENLERASPDRPILLVANHRSFFDMYAVSTVLFRRTDWPKRLFFPVRGRFFYQSPLGALVNFIMGWWSMYPPIFATAEKRAWDAYAMRRLVELCREGRGHVIGFHPEGTRNKGPDPYSFLPPQPGIGRLIKEADPQVIPVFVTGLCNSLPRQIMRNWTDGEKIRIYFGAPLDLSRFADRRGGLKTYKEIADFVMDKIAELAELDRRMYAASPRREVAG
ncbi:lysophospholipid acyltransferase family protein [Pyrinomonas methylaliphatogenes]|jgi:1-acyl-sn-glycerol-3-phosphate acyltransferase|uniref:1-acyl-sn-glycerol-3-phosphate acyltransferase n=1 Tax=Pyrinomonas methylaliphatogenes TaxID=454194 RepID=A0A0B6WW27_9BACT|nr:lysophospholipid acyltransferase family protein [Pyrinomonas methylaliphatogenes]CDM65296.1 1-acyl-sn-glycerol-3-phosphate acyltransferase [Pyrinomonas methylaliphatogenes]